MLFPSTPHSILEVERLGERLKTPIPWDPWRSLEHSSIFLPWRERKLGVQQEMAGGKDGK